MLRFLFAVFLILHGLVHLLYLGQSQRIFELQPGMVWPDGSWAFGRLLGNETTRVLASTLLALGAAGLVASGAAIFARQSWWRPSMVGAAIFSAAIFILLWDGGMQHLDDKVAVGLLINVGIVIAVVALRWPSFGF